MVGLAAALGLVAIATLCPKYRFAEDPARAPLQRAVLGPILGNYALTHSQVAWTLIIHLHLQHICPTARVSSLASQRATLCTNGLLEVGFLLRIPELGSTVWWTPQPDNDSDLTRFIELTSFKGVIQKDIGMQNLAWQRRQ